MHAPHKQETALFNVPLTACNSVSCSVSEKGAAKQERCVSYAPGLAYGGFKYIFLSSYNVLFGMSSGA